MMNYQDYLSPEQAQKLAEMGDPQDEVEAMYGMQRMANNMGMQRLPERSNGRVWGATSPMEAIGGMAQQLSGAYMNKTLADKYGEAFKTGNQNRGTAAKMIAEALRRAQQAPAYEKTGMSMGSDGMISYDPNAGY